MCEVCGGPTRVLETREGEHGSVMRRRECTTHQHRFVTFEINSAPFNNAKARIGQYAGARQNRIRVWLRDASLVNDPRPTRQIAREMRMSPGRVRQIKRGHI